MKKSDIVKWKSQSHGRSRTKTGKVIAIVPKRIRPWAYVPIGMYLEKGDAKRPHESYLVKLKGSNRIYHPRVQYLRLCRVRTWLSRYLWPFLGFVLVIIILGIVGESDRQSWQAVEQAYHPKYSIRYTPSRWVRNQAKVGGVVRICGDRVYSREWKHIGYLKDGQVYNLKGHRKGVAP